MEIMNNELYPKNKKLFENASSYVKNGRLIKYRWSSDEVGSIDYDLSYIASKQLALLEGMMNYLKEKGNLVVEENGKIETFNFNKERLKLSGL